MLDAQPIIDWYSNYSSAVASETGSRGWRKFVSALWDSRKTLRSVRMRGDEVADLLADIADSLRRGIN